ncbi:Acetylglucosaminyltransferase EXT1/exostosin 1 [Handroanthus impetiginosus]|uniref:Acetylglucosaminyltransferase EXT1/exostosin 1 n=1 Tax=Handroanthus impetiginosus TaxID=429701 RepID=A0A2G9GMN0_9LAMI|nr:Acetylglucosaminyltransferase EXT1/exostosin 1 [Handroanthus impetiginosus]
MFCGFRMSKMGLLTYKSLFFWFLMTSALFIISWFLVLRSTGRSHSVDFGILPNSKLLGIPEDENLDESPLINGGVNWNKNLRKCDTNKPVLKVFMYDLPSEFHFDLLGWKGGGKNIWPDIQSKVPEYPGGLNLQHSIEYWLTLDLLNSEFSENLRGRSAIRVRNSSEADVLFVPFFSSISYNRWSKLKPGQNRSTNVILQEKLVNFLTAQEEWKRSTGKDHIIVAHHPNSLIDARMKLWPAMFILSDFGRYPPTIANVKKDVIAPYMHVIKSYVDDSSDFDSRPILLYFRGSIYRKDGGKIRQELYYMLKNETDVHFSFGTVQNDGIKQASKGMHSSKFCLNIAGDTPSSNRLFDAIASHCVPVIISDEIELPYEDILDYSEFCIFVRTSDALKETFLLNLIRNISKDEWTRMWKRLKEIEHFYEFQYPSQENDAVQMIWQAVARKVPAIKREIHRSRRFSLTSITRERGLRAVSVPRNFG